MTLRTGKAAWDHGKTFVGKPLYRGLCKAFVREECFNVDPSRSLTAREAWAETVHKHPTSNPENVPAYVWVFMNTSASAEHAVMSGPLNSNGKRLCLSVDAGPDRTIAVVSLATLAAKWGPVVGWGEDLDGQRIWTPPAVAKEAAQATAPTVTVVSRFKEIVSIANQILDPETGATSGTANYSAAWEIRAIAHKRL